MIARLSTYRGVVATQEGGAVGGVGARLATSGFFL